MLPKNNMQSRSSTKEGLAMKTSSIESESTLLPRQHDVENLIKNKLSLSDKDSEWDQRLIEQCLGGVLIFS
jgi:hypothetical protein